MINVSGVVEQVALRQQRPTNYGPMYDFNVQVAGQLYTLSKKSQVPGISVGDTVSFTADPVKNNKIDNSTLANQTTGKMPYVAGQAPTKQSYSKGSGGDDKFRTPDQILHQVSLDIAVKYLALVDTNKRSLKALLEIADKLTQATKGYGVSAQSAVTPLSSVANTQLMQSVAAVVQQTSPDVDDVEY